MIWQAKAFSSYVKSLDDPESVANVSKKYMGADGHLAVDARPDAEMDSHAPQSSPDGGANGREESTGRSRWDELRKEAAGASPSTWDKIRENKERSRINNETGGAPQGDDLSEQQQFDALLEAERKMSRS